MTHVRTRSWMKKQIFYRDEKKNVVKAQRRTKIDRRFINFPPFPEDPQIHFKRANTSGNHGDFSEKTYWTYVRLLRGPGIYKRPKPDSPQMQLPVHHISGCRYNVNRDNQIMSEKEKS